ncbi:efflux RND transporter permease subunit [Aliifodinibius sp. S!AR15-10]|uniref:efflux RND transporter permease subunit n=1 Tax=Aliifodinibius sp. S!AR15-10 TaxID=2950437 RepID=UPI002866F3CA|nr:efflux RND transporter permease subunit [Aliifodinibius sp. S!AR15-10]MDR8390798.1 efflux RND transporter permease subunit [Aliifodinibius sp. S!AR15-10]
MKKFTVAGKILNRPITVIMITLVVIGFGAFSLSNLKITLYPSFNIPILAVQTNYSNVAPEDMQNLVVEPIEGAISSVQGIETLESNISKGSAFIILRLKNGVNIRNTELKVREAIARIRNELPTEASEPVIFQFDPENFPIMRLSLDANNKGLDELRRLGVEFIEPRIERLEGVASADTRGGLERKVFVNVDPMSLAQHQLVPSDIESALRSNNAQVAMGNIISGTNSYSLVAESMYQNVDEIRQTIIKMTDQNVPVRVKDVAKVEDSFAEVQTLVEINGKNSVSVEVQKKSDANTLDVANAVLAELPTINSNLPPGVNLQVLTNDGENVQNSISNLTQSSLAALIVVIIVLLIFMGGWRISLVVAATIPVSVTASFAGMYAAGLTLNILTITALALAVGLLVDNAIVVSESIARKLEEDLPKMQAALEGTNEVIGALLGATLTTLGVFTPIVGISGIQGQFFAEFALTISIAIGISFISSIILVPVLSLLFLNKEEFNRHSGSFKGIHKLEEWYARSLRWMMFRKWMVLLFVGVLLGGTYLLYNNMAFEFFTESDSGRVSMSVELPSGTKLVRTAQAIRDFGQQIQQKEEVEMVITNIGQRGFTSRTNIGEITVNLVDQSKRDISTNEFSAQLRRELSAPGVEVNIRGGGGGFGGFGGGITLTLVGPDIEVLQAISDKIEMKMLADPNVISVDNGRTDPTPELQYRVDRQRISRMGRSLNEVANSLKTQVQGTRTGYLRQQGREVPIEVRATKTALTSREQLFDLELVQVDSQRVSVAALGRFESVEGVNEISRRDRETVLDVSIEVAGNTNEYREKIISFIQQEVVLPAGYRYEFTGGTQDSEEGSNEVMWSLLFALALTYMIMASLFENFRDPFIIWFSIPLAFFGALMGLWLSLTPLSATAFIGIFMLVGIIVNNGIVLVDYMHLYTNDNAHAGSLFDNVIEACKRRMRPILLTALTTICSMIPLSLGIGTGAEIWTPLARAVMGGLFFGSILTLYVVPIFVMGISKERREAINAER